MLLLLGLMLLVLLLLGLLLVLVLLHWGNKYRKPGEKSPVPGLGRKPGEARESPGRQIPRARARYPG